MITRLSSTLRKYIKGWFIIILFLLDGLFMVSLYIGEGLSNSCSNMALPPKAKCKS